MNGFIIAAIAALLVSPTLYSQGGDLAPRPIIGMGTDAPAARQLRSDSVTLRGETAEVDVADIIRTTSQDFLLLRPFDNAEAMTFWLTDARGFPIDLIASLPFDGVALVPIPSVTLNDDDWGLPFKVNVLVTVRLLSGHVIDAADLSMSLRNNSTGPAANAVGGGGGAAPIPPAGPGDAFKAPNQTDGDNPGSSMRFKCNKTSGCDLHVFTPGGEGQQPFEITQELAKDATAGVSTLTTLYAYCNCN